MKIYEIVLIGLGLAMDAFAASVCKGLSIQKNKIKKAFLISTLFGLFQSIMPICGYYLGNSFQNLVNKFDHWIAFGLLSFIGFNMIKESFKKNLDINDKINFISLIFLSIATSIDALATGITFAFFNTNIFLDSLFIGLITFLLSLIGFKLGNKFGNKFHDYAEILGRAYSYFNWD